MYTSAITVSDDEQEEEEEELYVNKSTHVCILIDGIIIRHKESIIRCWGEESH